MRDGDRREQVGDIVLAGEGGPEARGLRAIPSTSSCPSSQIRPVRTGSTDSGALPIVKPILRPVRSVVKCGRIHGSSRLTATSPPAWATAESAMPSSRATVGRSLRFSRCSGAIIVSTAAVALTSFMCFSIAPGSSMPISTTAAPCLSVNSSRVIGMPTKPLRLPCVRSTSGHFPRRAAASSSLVVVFPTLPATATSGSESSRRQAPPSLR